MNNTKNLNINLIFIFSLLLLYPAQYINAQIEVIHVKNTKVEINEGGLFYALPVTYLKIDVAVEKTQKIRGPYYEFAEKYLGIKDVIWSNSVNYKIMDIGISTFCQPDPENYYYVQLGEKASKEEKSLLIHLTRSGLIQAINDQSAGLSSDDSDKEKKHLNIDYSEYFKYQADNNFYEKIDTIIRKINIDTITIERQFYKSSWLEKSDEQKAKDAADYLEKIRENRFLLITGYQEVNYGESIEYMDNELKKLEDEYLSLFTGVTKKGIINYTFTYLPDAQNSEVSEPVFKFSESKGAFDLSGSIGGNVMIQIDKIGNTSLVSEFIKNNNITNIEPIGFYYRLPEYAEITVKFNNEVIAKSTALISQFGIVTNIPSLDTEMQFYPETGSIRKVLLK